MGECKLRGLANAQRFRSLYRYSRVEAELNSRNGKLGDVRKDPVIHKLRIGESLIASGQLPID